MARAVRLLPPTARPQHVQRRGPKLRGLAWSPPPLPLPAPPPAPCSYAPWDTLRSLRSYPPNPCAPGCAHSPRARPQHVQPPVTRSVCLGAHSPFSRLTVPQAARTTPRAWTPQLSSGRPLRSCARSGRSCPSSMWRTRCVCGPGPTTQLLARALRICHCRVRPASARGWAERSCRCLSCRCAQGFPLCTIPTISNHTIPTQLLETGLCHG
jgi:hypothetical protein